MPKKTNPLLEQEKRREEMEQLVQKAMTTEAPEDNPQKTKLTLLLPIDDIAKIKKIAIDRRTSVSGLIHEWINNM